MFKSIKGKCFFKLLMPRLWRCRRVQNRSRGSEKLLSAEFLLALNLNTSMVPRPGRMLCSHLINDDIPS